MRVSKTVDNKVFKSLINGLQTELHLKITDANVKLLCEVENQVFKSFRPITEIELRNGLTDKAQKAIFEVKGVYRDTFINFIPPGMKKGDSAFTIEIGNLIV